ncbi:hypothetical protein IQ07DRAFT_639569 [Pyrenochaeta sp. DS3sAY3a]|nr:hypothetical protein IQ07DRAFT_639569 [Pyrenochaeta sp. DS3sAY3a]
METALILSPLSPAFRSNATPPSTTQSPGQMCFLESSEIEIPNPFSSEYETINAQERCRVQDYEIALLKLQLRDRDRELQTTVEAQERQESRNTITELVRRITKQRDAIETLNEEVRFWKVYAMEAKSMLERTYSDLDHLAKGPSVTEERKVAPKRPQPQRKPTRTRLPVPTSRLSSGAKSVTEKIDVAQQKKRKDSVIESD